MKLTTSICVDTPWEAHRAGTRAVWTPEVRLVAPVAPPSVAAVNARHWATAKRTRRYARRPLRQAELGLFERYAEQLSGEVLELGCGAGRLTGYLVSAARSVSAIDISPAMIELCSRRFPQARYYEQDIRDLDLFDAGQFSAVVAGRYTIDTLEDSERRVLLEKIHRVLADDGVLIMSSHNLACESLVPLPSRNLSANPLRLAKRLIRLPTALRNRAQLGWLQEREHGYAILNDFTHDYSVLHYYISRDGQEIQFAQHGFLLNECVALDGTTVPRGATAFGCRELHYAAVPVG
jgi:SAM-dependent methyltransferase